MAKSRTENTDITRVQPNANPDYLAQYMEEDQSIEQLKEYRTFPRLKVIQAMTNAALKEQANVNDGDVLVYPGNVCIAQYDRKEKASTPVQIVPLFFFAEYCKWADRKDTNSPAILERSFDKASLLAQKAKDPNRRKEKYNEGKFEARYVEHLNFICILYSGDQKGLFVTLTFSRGEYGTGMNFINCIGLRKAPGQQRPFPLWSQIWEVRSHMRTKAENSWYGVDVTVPGEPVNGNNLITAEEVEAFRSQYLEIQEAYKAKRIAVVHEDEDRGEDGEGGDRPVM